MPLKFKKNNMDDQRVHLHNNNNSSYYYSNSIFDSTTTSEINQIDSQFGSNLSFVVFLRLTIKCGQLKNSIVLINLSVILFFNRADHA